MAEITSALVKALREKTGLGILDCQKALKENDGDLVKAEEALRKKGMIKAGTRTSRAANEGVVGSYIHMQGNIGVLLEVNCETDFVARNDAFKDLVKDIAMHIAAAAPLYVKPEDVPAEKLEKEKEIAGAQVVGKPANIVEKIVAGKIDKFYSDVCLLKQPFIKDDSKSVDDLV
jgi:elongation factor Ts